MLVTRKGGAATSFLAVLVRGAAADRLPLPERAGLVYRSHSSIDRRQLYAALEG